MYNVSIYTMHYRVGGAEILFFIFLCVSNMSVLYDSLCVEDKVNIKISAYITK